ncbi:hypothetical protein EJB05_18672, partial [Eragrostis curvula]
MQRMGGAEEEEEEEEEEGYKSRRIPLWWRKGAPQITSPLSHSLDGTEHHARGTPLPRNERTGKGGVELIGKLDVGLPGGLGSWAFKPCLGQAHEYKRSGGKESPQERAKLSSSRPCPAAPVFESSGRWGSMREALVDGSRRGRERCAHGRQVGKQARCTCSVRPLAFSATAIACLQT